MIKTVNEKDHYAILKKKETILYKFISLGTVKDIDKLVCLKNECLWFDVAKNQNDPFELVNVRINKNILKNDENIYDAFDKIEKKIEILKPCIKLTSFTTNMVENICMWSYYTNCYKGFCLKFKLIDYKKPKYKISKIKYKKEIQGIDEEALQAFSRMSRLATYNFGSNLQQADLINDLISELSCYKGDSWKHEKEYRGLCLDDLNIEGTSISFKDLNLELVGIYAGPYCGCSHLTELENIANTLKVKFEKLECDTKNYKLISK